MAGFSTFRYERYFVDALCDYLLANYQQRDTGLAEIHVFLPTRRSGLALTRTLFEKNEGISCLLPHIHILGDIQLLDWLPIERAAHHSILPNVSHNKRLIKTAELVMAHGPIAKFSPTRLSMTHAMAYAESLLAMRDDCIRADIAYHAIRQTIDGEYAQHWDATLSSFLDIMDMLDHWLAQQQLTDPPARQLAINRAVIEQWQQHPPSRTIIAAGSTGSTPATSELLRCIAKMEKGHVILPGFDPSLTMDTWQQLNTNHPQYAFKKLLDKADYPREDVQIIDVDATTTPRDAFISHMMLPEQASDALYHYSTEQDVVHGIEIIETDNDIAEIECCALRIREALAAGSKYIMIVSDSDSFATHLTALLSDANIYINHSTGMRATQHAGYTLLSLVASLLFTPYDSVTLLSILRHPFSFAHDKAAILNMTDTLDRRILRGWHNIQSLQDVITQLTRLIAPNTISDIVHQLSDIQQRVDTYNTLSDMAALHIEALELIIGSDQLARSHPDYVRMRQFIEEIRTFISYVTSNHSLHKSEYFPVISHIFNNMHLPQARHTDANIAIVGTLEARMQKADLIIIPHMNEGNWPKRITVEHWLNMAMRHQLGLDFVYRRIGLAAHDICMLLKAPQICFIRAKKEKGSITQASRFIERLRLAIIPHANDGKRWHKILPAWHHHMVQQHDTAPATLPTPTPSIDIRCKALHRISATTFETLFDNPFAVFISHICGLREADPLDDSFNQKYFGNALHKAMDRIAHTYDGQHIEHYLSRLEHDVTQHLNIFVPPSQRAFHMQRLERIINSLIQEEQQRAEHINSLETETTVEHTYSEGLLSPLTLHARIDRVEKRHDGSICITDYKTGNAPPPKKVQEGYRCQLLVAGLLLAEEMDCFTTNTILEYWKLNGKRQEQLVHAIYPHTRYWNEPIDWNDIRQKLLAIAAYYCHKADSSFRWNIDTSNPYDTIAKHIARVGEW